MTATSPPPAPRLRAPSWRDPKLVVGLLLVLTSVVVGGRVVADADRTVAVWAARSTLASGDPVGPDAVTAVRVRLDDAVARYLPADQPVPSGLVALRTFGPGELVPAGAVGDAAAMTRTPLGLPHEGPLPTGLVRGARVDVWITPPADPGAAAGAVAAASGPVRLAQRVEVVEVSAPDGAFSAGAGTTVQVLLSEDEVAAALTARAGGADVALLLVPGTTPSAR